MFGTPEINVGVFPFMIMALIYRNVPRKKASELLLLGERIDAHEALRIGLVNRVVAPPTLDASVATLAADIARSPRGGLEATKRIVAAIRAGGNGREAEGYAAALRTSPAARERIREFASRKKR